MLFNRLPPSRRFKDVIKEFWLFENANPTPVVQKIIPDGYSEIIIHYGDEYRAKLNGNWEDQERILFSNQISNFFLLENKGRSAMLGIKLHPTSFYQLSRIHQAQFTDQVVNLNDIIKIPKTIKVLVGNGVTTKERIDAVENWFTQILGENLLKPSISTLAYRIIFEKNGLLPIEDLAESLNISRRHLEREFQKEVGLSPKLFARIVKFNYIFQVMKNEDWSWVQVALQSGYFDQSHFIKNFKDFSGEEPSSYGFDKENLTNFFLKIS